MKMKTPDLHAHPIINNAAWIATLGVDLFVLGSGLWIIGADGDASLQFASFAALMVIIKAIAWSNNWTVIGGLAAIIGVFFFMAYGVMHYEIAAPLAAQVEHGPTWTGLQSQIDLNLTQLALSDLSKESRVALLNSNTALTTQQLTEAARELESLKPRLTTRHLFSSMVGIFSPGTEAAKILCVIVFGGFGVLLEATVFRITPRVETAVEPILEEVPQVVVVEPEQLPLKPSLAYTSTRPKESTK